MSPNKGNSLHYLSNNGKELLELGEEKDKARRP